MDSKYSKQPNFDAASVSSNEKVSASQLENNGWSAQKQKYIQAGLSPEDANFLVDVSPKQQGVIFRKVDVRLVPMLALLYLIAHLDRANIGNAKIEGIEKTLDMHGTDYNLAVMIFFVPYILCEVPSNIILARISQTHGLGGLEGWRWIFIIEGIASVAIGASCYLLLPDTPSLSPWLKPEEKRFVNLIHHATRGTQRDSLTEPGQKKTVEWSILFEVLKDYHIYLQMLVFMSNSVPNYALKFTMPQIIRNMGFTSTTAQLLTAPPYLMGATSAMIVGFFADRTQKRMPYQLGCQSLLILAYSILFVKAAEIANNVALCYVMVTFACIGVYPIVPGCTAWTVNNLANAEKRSVGTAWLISLGNCGGVVGSWIFLEKEKPRCPTGFGSPLSFGAAGFVCALALGFLYNRHNKKYENMTEEDVTREYTEAQLRKMGDRSPLFRYNL